MNNYIDKDIYGRTGFVCIDLVGRIAPRVNRTVLQC